MGEHPTGTVSELWRYPVKSMLGERLEQSDVTEAGVAGDRAFALVDVETGNIVSAKRPLRWQGLLELGARLSDDGTVTVAFPDGTTCSGRDNGFATRLSEFLGREVSVASTASEGAVFEEVWDPGKSDSPLYGPQVASEGGQPMVTLQPSPVAPPGTFFDFSAIHLVTTSSLAALQSSYPAGAVDARRFRPNLVVEVPDADGFVENDWTQREIAIGEGGLTLRTMIPTMRCVMTTLAQPGLVHDPGILQATNRVNRVSIQGMGEYACVGVYARVTQPGPVQVGDAVHVR